MEIKVLFYGKVSDTTLVSSAKYRDIQDTKLLAEHLETLYPQLNNIQYSIAINQIIIKDFVLLKDGDVIAVLPPFAGG